MTQPDTTRPDVDTRPPVSPRADIFENDREILLVVDLPGVPEVDVRLQVDQGTLLLEADTRPDEPTGRPLAREIPDIRYRGAYSLPRDMDIDNIRAELRNGVLRVHLPRAAKVEPRRIPVGTVH